MLKIKDLFISKDKKIYKQIIQAFFSREYLKLKIDKNTVKASETFINNYKNYENCINECIEILSELEYQQKKLGYIPRGATFTCSIEDMEPRYIIYDFEKLDIQKA